MNEENGMDASAVNGMETPSRRMVVSKILSLGVLLTGRVGFCPAVLADENPDATRSPIRNDARDFSVYPKNRKELNREDIVMQRRDFSCGAAALATVFRYYWREPANEDIFLQLIQANLSLDEFRDRVQNGLTLTDLQNAVDDVGYEAVIGTLTLEELGESLLPLIVGITVNDYDHFVVVRGIVRGYVYLADPIYGRVRTPADQFAESWQENAILAVIKPGADPMKSSPLFVTEYEASRGQLNNLVIRNQITGRVFP